MGVRHDIYPKYKAKKTWKLGEDNIPMYSGSVIYEKRGKGKKWCALFTVMDFGEARERASMLNDAVVNQFVFKGKNNVKR